MKLYIAGPMTGVPQHNTPAFCQAAVELEYAGHTPYNPAVNQIEGEEWEGYQFKSSDEWSALTEDEYEAEYRLVMHRDIEWILACDGVALLPGWGESKGATFERSVADFLGKEVKTIGEWLKPEGGRFISKTALSLVREPLVDVPGQAARELAARSMGGSPGARPASLNKDEKFVWKSRGGIAINDPIGARVKDNGWGWTGRVYGTYMDKLQVVMDDGQRTALDPSRAGQIELWFDKEPTLPEQTLIVTACDDEQEFGLVAPHYAGDAGFDLVCSDHVHLPPGEFADINCNVAVALPPGHWGLITGRSSSFRTHKLLVLQGVIDEGWRGPLAVGVTNMDSVAKTVEPGMRLAQLIVMPRVVPPLEVRTALPPGDRGRNGFGSTG